MERRHKLVFRFEWNRVESLCLAVGICMRQSGFFSRYDQCRLCWIAFYTSAAIFANKHGVVTKQTCTKTGD